jgi:hypothetical protein
MKTLKDDLLQIKSDLSSYRLLFSFIVSDIKEGYTDKKLSFYEEVFGDISNDFFFKKLKDEKIIDTLVPISRRMQKLVDIYNLFELLM